MTTIENDKRPIDPVNTAMIELAGEQLVWLFTEERYIAVKVKNILYLESLAQPKESTKILFVDEDNGKVRVIISSYGIGRWEQRFSGFNFLRVHRAYLVNYNMLTVYSRREGLVQLKHVETKLPVSKEGKKLMSAIITIAK